MNADAISEVLSCVELRHKKEGLPIDFGGFFVVYFR